MKINRKFNLNRKPTSGLILLELVVALGIFLSVVAIGMGALLTMYGVNKKSQTLKVIMNDLNFVVESMAREIVVGTVYNCGASNPLNESKNCPIIGGDDHDLITFCSSDNQQIFYRYNSSYKSIQRYIEEDDDENTCGQGNPDDDEDADEWITLTAVPEVEIDRMDFYVEGAEDSQPTEHPRVLMVIEGSAGAGTDEESDFRIQTYLSQRTPKIPES